jgi:hypothetical protein
MTPAIDPSELATSYVLGTLGPDDRRGVDEAVASTPALRREIDATAAALTQAVAASLPPVDPPPELRQRILASLDGPERFRGFFPELCRILALPVEAVRAVLGRIDDPAGWTAIRPGIARLKFAAGTALAGAEATLLRLGPGVVFPRHEHVGAEMALVLEGAGHDEGHVYAPGQLIAHAPGTTHEFTAGELRDLVLVVVHHGVKFR